jgi:hypothetical protein
VFVYHKSLVWSSTQPVLPVHELGAGGGAVLEARPLYSQASLR